MHFTFDNVYYVVHIIMAKKKHRTSDVKKSAMHRISGHRTSMMSITSIVFTYELEWWPFWAKYDPCKYHYGQRTIVSRSVYMV
jgi:hypothetical protein